MPSLPRPLRRGPRSRADGVAPEPETPRVEQIDAAGLRWINIERPRPIDRAWLEERFDFHPLDYEDVFSRNQRPKVDEYDDYLFVVLHFPRYDKRLGRLNAAELDAFIGPDFVITLPNETLQALKDLERHKRYVPEDLEMYFDDINDASERVWDLLENFKEVVEALESTNESVLSHEMNNTFRVLTAISV